MSPLDVVAAGFLLAGAALCVIGSLGLIRLPDFYTRIHAAGVIDTLGAPLILIGLSLHAGWNLLTIKMALILGFLLLASATTGHALAKAAFAHGLKPFLHEDAASTAVPPDAPPDAARATGEGEPSRP